MLDYRSVFLQRSLWIKLPILEGSFCIGRRGGEIRNMKWVKLKAVDLMKTLEEGPLGCPWRRYRMDQWIDISPRHKGR